MKFKRLFELSRCQWAAQEKSQWDKDDFIRKSQGDAEFSSLKPTALKPTVGPVPNFRPRLREPQGPSDHSSRVGFHPGQDKTQNSSMGMLAGAGRYEWPRLLSY